jgi:vancomycin permeability regulator SanA
MDKKRWNPYTNVIVCGVDDGQFTADGRGYQTFENLFEAQKIFPDLNPTAQSKRFTCARGNPEEHQMRFDTWAAENLYSR